MASIRFLFLSLALTFVLGCANPEPENLVRELSPGDSKERIIEVLGEPDLRREVDNDAIWVYHSPSIARPVGSAGIQVIIRDGKFEQSIPVKMQ